MLTGTFLVSDLVTDLETSFLALLAFPFVVVVVVSCALISCLKAGLFVRVRTVVSAFISPFGRFPILCLGATSVIGFEGRD